MKIGSALDRRRFQRQRHPEFLSADPQRDSRIRLIQREKNGGFRRF